jgi:hypothetical protein
LCPLGYQSRTMWFVPHRILQRRPTQPFEMNESNKFIF